MKTTTIVAKMFAICAFALIAAAFGTTKSYAQEGVKYNVILNDLAPDDFPLTIVDHYEKGDVERKYDAVGEYTETHPAELGAYKGYTLGDGTFPPGGGGTCFFRLYYHRVTETQNADGTYTRTVVTCWFC